MKSHCIFYEIEYYCFLDLLIKYTMDCLTYRIYRTEQVQMNVHANTWKKIVSQFIL